MTAEQQARPPPQPPDGTPTALALAAGGGADLVAVLRWRDLQLQLDCNSQGLTALDTSLAQVRSALNSNSNVKLEFQSRRVAST